MGRIPIHVADYRPAIDALITEGRSLADMEEFIGAARLDSDQRAALWLLAWAHQQHRAQRRIARDALAALP